MRGLAPLVALFSVDGLRDRVEVVADDAGAALFDWVNCVGAVAEEGRRAGLVGDFDLGLVLGGA